MKKHTLIVIAALLMAMIGGTGSVSAASVGFNVDCTGAYGYGDVPDHTTYTWTIQFYDYDTSLVNWSGSVNGPASFSPSVAWPVPPSTGTSQTDSYYWWDVSGPSGLIAHGEGHFDCTTPPPPPPPSAIEGCTPGYWKQSQHFDSWVGYQPSGSFEAVFGRDVPGSPTLLAALGANGGGINALMRHATAALLNASNPVVDPDPAFDTTAEVIAAFQAAYDSGNYEATKDRFAASNEAGCPIN